MSTLAPRDLFVWMLTEPRTPALVGRIERLSNGDVSFTYCDNWLKTGFALSADLPLALNEYRPVHRRLRQYAAAGALDDARPDSWGEKVIRHPLRPHLRVSRAAMQLIRAGPQADIHQAAGGLARARVKRTGLDAHLADGIHGRDITGGDAAIGTL